VSRFRVKAKSVKTGVPKPAVPAPATGASSPPKVEALDKLNIFFAVFGAIAVVAGLLSRALAIIAFLGLAYVLTFTMIAIYEKSIKWPAWRVVIALALVVG
jgi:hypothetical protein